MQPFDWHELEPRQKFLVQELLPGHQPEALRPPKDVLRPSVRLEGRVLGCRPKTRRRLGKPDVSHPQQVSVQAHDATLGTLVPRQTKPNPFQQALKTLATPKLVTM